MQTRDAVGSIGMSEAQHCHVEHVRSGIRIAAEFEHRLGGDIPSLGPRGEIPSDEVAVEAVDPGGNRGVGGEHHRRSNE